MKNPLCNIEPIPLLQEKNPTWGFRFPQTQRHLLASVAITISLWLVTYSMAWALDIFITVLSHYSITHIQAESFFKRCAWKPISTLSSSTLLWLCLFTSVLIVVGDSPLMPWFPFSRTEELRLYVLTMEVEIPSVEGETEKCMRKQLAVIVRRVQWSYAIFWSLSTRQSGVLEWCYGYYNGDIKTRKTTQPTEVDPDEWGLQRSMQLRELYLSLSAGDGNQRARRPSASLSPEDLTDLEWYYLVCMSFTFSHGQGLPGRTLSIGSEIWLCNAHFADSKIFSRSLLAKSASIQTVVCFPFMGGVLELGTTEQVMENPDLIKQLTCSFWELPISVCSDLSISGSKKIEETCQFPSDIDKNLMCNKGLKNGISALEGDIWSENPTPLKPTIPYSVVCGIDANEEPTNLSEELRKNSPEYSSNNHHQNQQDADVYMLQHVNATCQVPSMQFFNNEFDDGLHASFKSSDCISQSLGKDQKLKSSTKGERIRSHVLHDIQPSNYSKLSSLDDDLHYRRTLSAILRNPCVQIGKPSFLDFSHASSFTTWKKSLASREVHISLKQKMLKKILNKVAWMHNVNPPISSDESVKVNKKFKQEPDNADLGTLMADRSRIELLSEKFVVLKSLIPAMDNKVDRTFLLDCTIKYLKDLERRVDELESCRGLGNLETVGKKKHPDMSERTSDNCGSFGTGIGKKSCLNKRKACDKNDDDESNQDWMQSKDAINVAVTIIEKEVLIEITCPWREFLLFEIVDAISNIHLDAHSVQSSNVDGILSLTIKSKFHDVVTASPGMIKKALHRVVGKY